MSILSKSKIKIFQSCPRRLWLSKFKSELEVKNPQMDLIARRGTEFGEVVLSDFPNGKLVKTLNTDEALELTADIFKGFASGASVLPVFEGAFLFDDVVVRVDIMNPVIVNQELLWDLIEVKSGQIEVVKNGKLVRSSKFEEYLSDAASQQYIVENSGVKLNSVKLGVPNKDFVYQERGNYSGLLKCYDITVEAKKIQEKFSEIISAAKHIYTLSEAPEEVIDSKCATCGFIEYCSDTKTKESDASIRIPTWYLGGSPNVKRVQEAMSYSRDLADIDDELLPEKKFREMKLIAENKKDIYIDQLLFDHLSSQPWPRYFLDYEFLSTPLPIWLGSSPSTTIPYQYSIHKWSGPGDLQLTHFEFIAESDIDPRWELARSLIASIEDGPPIYTWSGKGVEGPITEKLIDFVETDEQKERLQRISNSCVENDLLPWFRDYFYTLGMHGQSIKQICKYFLPSNPYDTLNTKNGVDAMDGYEKFLRAPSAVEKQLIKKDLLDYCGVDTEAMILIWRHILAQPKSIFS
jgi:CRISPR/Cas system-associated exonuclease Cas4 (RecB family)